MEELCSIVVEKLRKGRIWCCVVFSVVSEFLRSILWFLASLSLKLYKAVLSNVFSVIILHSSAAGGQKRQLWIKWIWIFYGGAAQHDDLYQDKVSFAQGESIMSFLVNFFFFFYMRLCIFPHMQIKTHCGPLRSFVRAHVYSLQSLNRYESN